MIADSHWGDEFEGAATLIDASDDLFAELAAAIDGRRWDRARSVAVAIAVRCPHHEPELRELAGCIRLLADDCLPPALARLCFSPLVPFAALPPDPLDALSDALVAALAEVEGGGWVRLAASLRTDASEEGIHNQGDNPADESADGPGSFEALESLLFDLASSQRDAGWSALSAWVASRQVEAEDDDDTIAAFGRSAIELRPDVAASHGLLVRVLLNLDDEPAARQVFSAAQS